MGLGTNLKLSEDATPTILDEFDQELIDFMGSDSWNDNWEQTFPTGDDVLTLLKGLVLLEKYYKTHRGSASATAAIYRKVSELKLESPELIDWILRNKSMHHAYTPFGAVKFGHLRSYEEYKKFLEVLRARELGNDPIDKMHERNRKLKKQEKVKNAEQHLQRKFENFKKKNEHLSSVEAYMEKNSSQQVLFDWRKGNLPFPQNLISHKKLEQLEKDLVDLDENEIVQLIERIPRKSPEHLKQFKKKLNYIKMKIKIKKI